MFCLALVQFQERRYAEAEATFKRVIEMGDVLPQPWANLAGCYMWQERYDEAEAAYKRALEVDPDYSLARQNLQLLPLIRQRGLASLSSTIKQPFAETPIHQSLTFIE